MKHHSILSQSCATLSSFRNLMKYSSISPTAINGRKLFIEYSRINNDINLPERQLISLHRWSKVNSLMTQQGNNNRSMKDQRFVEPSSWRGLPEEESAHSSISPVRSPRLQPFHAQGPKQRWFFFPVPFKSFTEFVFHEFMSPLKPIKKHPVTVSSTVLFMRQVKKQLSEVSVLCLLFHSLFWQERRGYLPFTSPTTLWARS